MLFSGLTKVNECYRLGVIMGARHTPQANLPRQHEYKDLLMALPITGDERVNVQGLRLKTRWVELLGLSKLRLYPIPHLSFLNEVSPSKGLFSFVFRMGAL